MRFRIVPTEAETTRGCQAMIAATFPRSKAQLVVAAVYFLVGASAFTLVPSSPVLVTVIAVGGMMLMMFALQLEANSRTRRARRDDPHTEEAHDLEVSTEGIRAWCAHVDTRYTWDGITKVVESNEFYVFVRGSGGGPALPKRVLASDEESELRQLIAQCSPDRGAGLARVLR